MNKLHCTDRGIPRWSEHRCHVETGPGYQFCSVCRLQRRRWWTVGRFGWQNRDANLSRRRWWRQQKSTSPSRFWSSDERRKVSSFPLKFWTLSYYHLFFYLLIHRWHRLGISIKGNVVTLIKDCEQQVTRPLPRQGQKLSSSGIILIGQQLLDESYYSVREWEVSVCARSCILYICGHMFAYQDRLPFNHSILLQGDLQQLILVPSPESAYEVCKQFMPDCSKPVGKVGDSGRNGASSSNTKRQLPLSVTASAGAETLVYAQAPNGSFVVSWNLW